MVRGLLFPPPNCAKNIGHSLDLRRIAYAGEYFFPFDIAHRFLFCELIFKQDLDGFSYAASALFDDSLYLARRSYSPEICPQVRTLTVAGNTGYAEDAFP